MNTWVSCIHIFLTLYFTLCKTSFKPSPSLQQKWTRKGSWLKSIAPIRASVSTVEAGESRRCWGVQEVPLSPSTSTSGLRAQEGHSQGVQQHKDKATRCPLPSEEQEPSWAIINSAEVKCCHGQCKEKEKSTRKHKEKARFGIKEPRQKDFCIERKHSKEEALSNTNVFLKLQDSGKESSVAVPLVWIREQEEACRFLYLALYSEGPLAGQSSHRHSRDTSFRIQGAALD